MSLGLRGLQGGESNHAFTELYRASINQQFKGSINAFLFSLIFLATIVMRWRLRLVGLASDMSWCRLSSSLRTLIGIKCGYESQACLCCLRQAFVAHNGLSKKSLHRGILSVSYSAPNALQAKAQMTHQEFYEEVKVHRGSVSLLRGPHQPLVSRPVSMVTPYD